MADSELGRLKAEVKAGPLPCHVAIIMDGNGRWAKQRGRQRVYGHRAGMESVKDVVEGAGDIGLDYLTLFAFSTENWQRPAYEVNALMEILVEHLERELPRLHSNGVRIRTLGDRHKLPSKVEEAVNRAVNLTRENDDMVLSLALNYGGRDEITRACRALARQVARGTLDPNQIDEEHIARHLYTSDLPDPDLLIRPSGEQRVSNFLLWQIAYTEFWYTAVQWPDFRSKHLYQALLDFQQRERRFGTVPVDSQSRVQH